MKGISNEHQRRKSGRPVFCKLSLPERVTPTCIDHSVALSFAGGLPDSQGWLFCFWEDDAFVQKK